MMTASAMSAAIRAKKKKMEEEHSDAVKLSGIPEDAQDINTLKMHEATDEHNENHPMERDEDPTLEELNRQTVSHQPHDEEAPYSTDPYGPEGIKLKKMAKIKTMMMKMGK